METEGMSFGMGQQSNAEECSVCLAIKTDEGIVAATMGSVGCP